ncbi:DNA/RNA helicase domain-containing protein [Saccharopolyspora sp. NFXS83]|uniref:DNA/RNA helicase domain-containing protein n=1 Tax=Saccharopolyspora sp. NFXS83 TaxID=2993560 RepID=UPI003A4E2668
MLRLLGLSDAPPIGWSDLVAGTRDEYVVHAATTAPSLEEWLLDRASMFGGSARISAGFCWDWNQPKKLDGKVELATDIRINGWHRPWNTPSGAEAPDAPRTSLWASDPRGFGQVGCVYTAQGLEYDWGGVLFGEDFVIRDGVWRAQQSATKDPSLRSTSTPFFDRLVRNTYKVLLTRGMHGVGLHSVDHETNEFLRRFAR